MYEENRNQGFDGNGNPDDHKPEETTPNFIMQEPAKQNQGYREAGSQNQAGSYDSQNPGRFQNNMYSGQSQNQAQAQPQGGEYYNQPTGNGNYGPYQGGPSFHQIPGNQGSPMNSTEPKKKKKNGRMVKRVAGITAAALLFGTVSGGTMVGVNMLADSMRQETYPQVSQSETLETAPQTQAVLPPNSNSGGASGAVALDVSAIVENAMPSIVAINNTMLYQSNSWFGGMQTYEVPSSGSGIIVGQNDEELLIVTNNHVVEDSNNLSVVFIDSTSVNAAIKGTDADFDLAVIAVPLKDIPAETLGQISVATMGDSDALKMGESVIAIGNALGHGQSVTVGCVSALDREVTTDGTTTRNLLQTDAAINPGNSGGALLNMKGEVVGINAAKYSSTDVEGIGYAIPISKAQDIISSLMTKRTRSGVVEEGKEGYLGIQGLTVDDSMAKQLGMPAGVFVSGIIEGGAASKTDLREKDIITKFDDQTVRSMATLQELLKYYKEGETVNITVQTLKDGAYEERTIEITLGGKATLGETGVPR